MPEFPDALIEKAAKALHLGWRAPFTPFVQWESESERMRDYFRSRAHEAVTAVAGDIQAKALRDAAESPECRTQRDYEWLNERADRIHPKEDPDA